STSASHPSGSEPSAHPTSESKNLRELPRSAGPAPSGSNGMSTGALWSTDTSTQRHSQRTRSSPLSAGPEGVVVPRTNFLQRDIFVRRQSSKYPTRGRYL